MSDGTVSNRQAFESGRQQQQSELVDRGERLPGVADALAAYRKFAPYAPAATVRTRPVAYSTGGNA